MSSYLLFVFAGRGSTFETLCYLPIFWRFRKSRYAFVLEIFPLFIFYTLSLPSGFSKMLATFLRQEMDRLELRLACVTFLYLSTTFFKVGRNYLLHSYSLL